MYGTVPMIWSYFVIWIISKSLCMTGYDGCQSQLNVSSRVRKYNAITVKMYYHVCSFMRLKFRMICVETLLPYVYVSGTMVKYDKNTCIVMYVLYDTILLAKEPISFYIFFIKSPAKFAAITSHFLLHDVSVIVYTVDHVIASSWLAHGGRDNMAVIDDSLKHIFLNEHVWILIKISPKCVCKGPINNIPELVQKMAWRRQGDRPLYESMMIRLLTHICVTQSQWREEI